jgi:hypothetical protein
MGVIRCTSLNAAKKVDLLLNPERVEIPYKSS